MSHCLRIFHKVSYAATVFFLSSQCRFDFMFEQQNWRYRICTANKLINSEIKANTKTNSFDAIEWLMKKKLPRKKYTKFQRLWSNYSQICSQIFRSHFHFKVKQYRSFKYEIFFLMKTPLSVGLRAFERNINLKTMRLSKWKLTQKFLSIRALMVWSHWKARCEFKPYISHINEEYFNNNAFQ